MAIIVDTIEELEATSVEGHVDSATRRFIATGAASTTSAILLEAFAASGIPREGHYFPGHSNLVCTGRRVRLLDNSNRQVEIVCSYQRIGMSRSTFLFSGSNQLGQVNSNLDRYGNQVFVSHTWDADDEDWPNQTHLQGMDTALLMPQMTLTAVGQLQVAYPDQIADIWVGSMNNTIWGGAAPYQWLCTRCDFSPLDVGYGRLRWWEFTFELQKARQGWIPQIFFIDSRTGKPPADLVPGVGIKALDWYGAINYNTIFPVR